MASEFGYRLTASAARDVDDIVSYLAVECGNPQAAAAFMGQLVDVLENTCLFPESGPCVSNEFLPDVGIRKKLVGSYVLYYLVGTEAQLITVLRVVHGKRNMEEVLASIYT